MRIIIAIDSLKGSLASTEAGGIIAEGIKRVYPEAEVRVCPLADGG
ncbi:MAG: glycerate kinase, partial [Lachnospiraceae bacterium]|nr:glycerate kinase [Lachnospiraceae bacterium]